MPKLSRLLILFNHDGDHEATLVEGNKMLIKTKIFMERVTSMTRGSIVTVQRKYGDPWTHGRVVRHASEDHNSRSYKIRMTKWDISSLKHNDM